MILPPMARPAVGRVGLVEDKPRLLDVTLALWNDWLAAFSPR
jgi:hypothetical protein